MYEIFLTDTAKQQLKVLPKHAQEEIGLALERIRVRPFTFVKRMRKGNYYRLRTSNYRIIMKIGETSLLITVIKIGTRENIYTKKNVSKFKLT